MKDEPRPLVAQKVTPGHPRRVVCRSMDRERQNAPSAVPPDGLATAHRVQVPAKETLFLEGDTAQSLFQVVSGVGKIYKMMPDGRAIITGFAYAEAMLGIARAGHYFYNVDAVTDLALDSYSRAVVEARLHEDPHYLQHMFEETNDELAQAQERILLLGQKTPIEKVTSFLRRIRRWQHEDRHIHVPMTRHDIADYLGLTTETVSRTFTQLRDQNVIRSINQHDIELLDVNQLKRLSEA